MPTATKNAPGNQTPNTPDVNESEIRRLRVDQLRDRLRRRGITGTAEMRKPELADALIKALRDGRGTTGPRGGSTSRTTGSTSRNSSGPRGSSGPRSTSNARSGATARSGSGATARSGSASRRGGTGEQPGNQTPNTPDVNESEIRRLKVDQLRDRLRRRGVTGTAEMRKPELADALIKALREGRRTTSSRTTSSGSRTAGSSGSGSRANRTSGSGTTSTSRATGSGARSSGSAAASRRTGSGTRRGSAPAGGTTAPPEVATAELTATPEGSTVDVPATPGGWTVRVTAAPEGSTIRVTATPEGATIRVTAVVEGSPTGPDRRTRQAQPQLAAREPVAALPPGPATGAGDRSTTAEFAGAVDSVREDGPDSGRSVRVGGAERVVASMLPPDLPATDELVTPEGTRLTTNGSGTPEGRRVPAQRAAGQAPAGA